MAIRRNGTQRTRLISHRFPLPPGTEGFEYDDNNEPGDEGDFDDSDDPEEKKKKKKKKKRKKKRKKKGKKKKGQKGKKRKGKKRRNAKEERRVNTPKSLQVVKQTIRTKGDGSQVVDITVDVDRIGRADKYEFRVVKKDNGNVRLVAGQ